MPRGRNIYPKLISLFALLFMLCAVPVQAQTVQAKIIENAKPLYKAGDSIQLQLTVKLDPRHCADGLNKSRIYPKGLAIVSQTDWKQVRPGQWRKQLTLLIRPKNNKAELTVLRRADKGSFFKQIKFPIQ